MNATADAWYRYDRGVGPIPAGPRPAASLGETAVCGTCGGVYLVARGHSCPGRP